ncbi:MAG: hypothetical protein AB8G23_22245 [Myxococcota bacterium]
MKRFICSTALAALCLLAIVLPGAAAAQGRLELAPLEQTSDASAPVRIEVSADFAAGILGGEFRVDYDSSVVHLAGIEWDAGYGDDPLLRCPGKTAMTGARGCRGDHTFVAMGNVNGLPSGAVADLVFVPVAEGFTDVFLEPVSPFSDLTGSQVSMILGAAEITVVPEPAFAFGLTLGVLGLASRGGRGRARKRSGIAAGKN